MKNNFGSSNRIHRSRTLFKPDRKDSKNPIAFAWLEFEKFNNNILLYLEDCYKLDNDPFESSYTMIKGLDYEKLKREKKVKLDIKQIDSVIDLIKKMTSILILKSITNYQCQFFQLMRVGRNSYSFIKI